MEKDYPLTIFSSFYSDFLFFNVFLESLRSSPLSRSRFLIFFSRAPSLILPEEGKACIFLGSSTPAGFMKVVDVELIAFFRAGARRSVPTQPLSKIACLAVFVSFFCSKPLSCPDVPDADIEIGLRCIFRFGDDSEASAVVGGPESWTTSGVLET